MINEELIALLQRLPLKAKVVVNMGRNDLANGREALNATSAVAVLRGGAYWQYPIDPEDASEHVINIIS